jgi:phosphoribosyl 1,2-cyclic phosphodiesterase/ActR/RegA family two-component response regulator
VKTVLIIDDDAVYRETMGELLRQASWRVLEASHGDAGIELARSQVPDVVLCDLLMPRGNGFQVCRALRSDEALRHARIVVTSGRDFPSDLHAAFAAGADEYLTKPVAPPQLLTLLARLSQQPASVPVPAEAETAPAPSGVSLKFWGVRGSIPTPGAGTVYYGGNTSCVEIRSGGQIIILDAGTGLRLLGHSLIAEFDNRALDLVLLLTHTHWDHIQGLPFFLPLYRPQNHLRILGYESASRELATTLFTQMETPFFPFQREKLPANVNVEVLRELEFTVGPIQVKACFANHPGICVGYRLFTPRGSIAFFPDNEPYQSGIASESASQSEDPGRRSFAQNLEDKMLGFIHGTDVLIMDAQYDEEEYRQHMSWGHGCLDDVVLLALRAQVKRLFLFHHDPTHDDAKISQMVTRARELVASRRGGLEVEAAREGSRIEL